MRRVLTLLVCSCFGITLGHAKGGLGKAKAYNGTPGLSGASTADVRFGNSDVHIIQQHYALRPVTLPPGLQKKLAKGKPLPPGWQKKLQPFPPNIEIRLSPLCGSCGRGVVDGYGVIYDKKTAIVLDVVRLVGDILR